MKILNYSSSRVYEHFLNPLKSFSRLPDICRSTTGTSDKSTTPSARTQRKIFISNTLQLYSIAAQTCCSRRCEIYRSRGPGGPDVGDPSLPSGEAVAWCSRSLAACGVARSIEVVVREGLSSEILICHLAMRSLGGEEWRRGGRKAAEQI